MYYMCWLLSVLSLPWIGVHHIRVPEVPKSTYFHHQSLRHRVLCVKPFLRFFYRLSPENIKPWELERELKPHDRYIFSLICLLLPQEILPPKFLHQNISSPYGHRVSYNQTMQGFSFTLNWLHSLYFYNSPRILSIFLNKSMGYERYRRKRSRSVRFKIFQAHPTVGTVDCRSPTVVTFPVELCVLWLCLP